MENTKLRDIDLLDSFQFQSDRASFLIEVIEETWDILSYDFCPDSRIFDAFCFNCGD